MKTHLDLNGKAIEVQRLASAHPRPNAPAMIFLHEGLGSISMWRDFPQRLADATGCEAILYSRHGYGQSTPLSAPRDVRYMHHEALDVLPALLDALDVDRPFLFGHSDGGSISLIHAGGAGRALSGVVVLAPHVFRRGRGPGQHPPRRRGLPAG
jgi:pimeloyl-ACP methyl ester carboxylesterase